MLHRPPLWFVCLVGFAFGALPGLRAQTAFGASTERLGYTGVVSVYDTLADAQAGRHARHVDLVVPQRDGTVFAADRWPELGPDAYAVVTNDYSDFEGVSPGAFNPNDVVAGFAQLYDTDASQWLARVGYWDADRRSFTLRIAGRNALHAGPFGMIDYARFWNAGAPEAGLEGTVGLFREFVIDLTAYFDRPAVRRVGAWVNDGNASDYAGSFRGIFENTSLSSPDSNGFYVFELRFNGVSWSAMQAFLHDNFIVADDYFASGLVLQDSVER